MPRATPPLRSPHQGKSEWREYGQVVDPWGSATKSGKPYSCADWAITIDLSQSPERESLTGDDHCGDEYRGTGPGDGPPAHSQGEDLKSIKVAF